MNLRFRHSSTAHTCESLIWICLCFMTVSLLDYVTSIDWRQLPTGNDLNKISTQKNIVRIFIIFCVKWYFINGKWCVCVCAAHCSQFSSSHSVDDDDKERMTTVQCSRTIIRLCSCLWFDEFEKEKNFIQMNACAHRTYKQIEGDYCLAF